MVKPMIIQIVQARCSITAEYTSPHLKSTFQKLFSSQTDFWWKSMLSGPSAVWILRRRKSGCTVMICYWFFKTEIICQRRSVPCSTIAFKNRVGLEYACRNEDTTAAVWRAPRKTSTDHCEGPPPPHFWIQICASCHGEWASPSTAAGGGCFAAVGWTRGLAWTP